jgi:hypothetical protein
MNKKLLFLALALLPLISCKKAGCTDAYAVNYSSEAEKDDESCTYSGKGIFWFNSVTATNLVNAGVPSVDFYIDGVLQGSASMTQFSVSAPVCGGDDGFTVTSNLGSENSVIKSYSIKRGGESTVIQTGNITIKSPGCNSVQLTY